MREDELIVLLLVFTFVIAVLVLIFRTGLRSQRLKLIHKAIETGNLDEVTRRDLVNALRPEKSEWTRGITQQLGWLARNLVFIGGWITMFSGVGVWIAAENFGWNGDYREGGLIASFVGFGLVTLPLALKELSRRQPAAER